MENLIDDILLEVFEYLDEGSLINCRNVCQRWKLLIDNHPEVSKHLTLNLDFVEDLEDSYKNFRFLRFEKILIKGFSDISLRCQKDCLIWAKEMVNHHKRSIKHATYHRFEWRIFPETVEKFENLQSLEISWIFDVPFNAAEINLPSLKSLKLFGVEEKLKIISPNLQKLVVIRGILSNEMLKNYANLTRLKFIEDERKTFKLLEMNRNTLKEIKLWTQNLHDEMEFAIYETRVEDFGVKLGRFKFVEKVNENVKSLRLKAFNGWGSRQIVEVCPNVTHLEIDDRERDFDLEYGNLLTVVEELPKIKDIIIGCTVNDFDENFEDDEDVFEVPNVESLTLDPYTIDSDESYVNFIVSFKDLKRIQLKRPYYAFTLNSEGFIKILDNLKDLEEITSNFILELSDEVVDFLIRSNVKLRRMSLAVYEEYFDKQKELASRLSRHTNIQCVITEVTEQDLSDAM